MNHHLKEQQILDYLFGLAEEAESARTEQHLAGCAECRKHADLLRRRFAALESLRETEAASERLIADTLRRVRVDHPVSESRFPSFAWIAAAAAALLVAVFIVAPRIGREPAMELTQTELSPAPAGGGVAGIPPASVAEPAAAPPPAAVPPPVEPPTGMLLADSAPMIAGEVADRDKALAEADEILSDAAGQPAAPMLAAARAFAPERSAGAGISEPPAPKTDATTVAKKTVHRPRKPRPADAKPYTARLPHGWSFAPTNEARVMLIPLKSKADGLMPPPAEGFRTRHWQVRVVNDATNAQLVSVTRTFDQPGWDLQLLNDEGRLARRSDLEAVIEADVPAGGVRAVHCTISEPLKENQP
ncbi:MAG TPA: zf-HC2 domain-containing protein [Kiritimatiellia bacterium]|nr:zf-HC2 domain-containing protein [Kiritimatiellia bacterium]HRZ13531.1 zf-HC2 domain-containing protein [Kiritimatiellia bacterium]HSA19164.1 zf-HC2 domain-containing protein [Kiritimatiellia bacterium]